MRRIIAAAWLLLLGVFVLPLLFMPQVEVAVVEAPTQPTATQPLDRTAVEEGTPTVDGASYLTLQTEDGTIETMTVADYLWGVVAAEMPASFEVEALKAQAVAARTYLVSKMETTVVGHPNADICTDHNCCQAYTTPAQAAEGWGSDAETYTQKIAAAVADTDGMVLYYEGEPIEAVFHSSSAGQTVDAVAVWGSDVPYLVGVESPEGEEVPNYQSTEFFTPEAFQTLIYSGYPQADLSGAVEGWCDNFTYNSSGGVDCLTVGGVSVGGSALRTLLGLRSANFSVNASEEGLTFSVTGYGHGVGMSQYGANQLAKEGMNYEGILLWYYTDVTLVSVG